MLYEPNYYFILHVSLLGLQSMCYLCHSNAELGVVLKPVQSVADKLLEDFVHYAHSQTCSGFHPVRRLIVDLYWGGGTFSLLNLQGLLPELLSSQKTCNTPDTDTALSVIGQDGEEALSAVISWNRTRTS